MEVIVALGMFVLASFAFVLLFGAPYVPTLTPQVAIALKLADLKPGETLLELGSGDGKVLLAAAKQGINAVGYELNPILFAISWVRTRRHRKYVKIICGNFWTTPWPEAQAIFVFLHPRFMKKLDKKIVQYKHKHVKLVSFAFEVPGKEPAANEKGVLLYQY